MGVEPSSPIASTIAACSAPVCVPPRRSSTARASAPETSTAHCLRASDSKPCASSTTQSRIGGRILPSASTSHRSSEWLVTTTSEHPARRRAPCRRHVPEKYGQRPRRHSPDETVSMPRGT